MSSSAEFGFVLNVMHRFKATTCLYQGGSVDDADGSIRKGRPLEVCQASHAGLYHWLLMTSR